MQGSKSMIDNMVDEFPKEHISHSQISMWLRCPAQWEFRYVKGIKIPPAGALIQGSCYHKALETNFRQKIESGRDMPVDDVRDAFSDEWEDAVLAEEINWEDREPEMLKHEGDKLVSVYQEEIAPSVSPALVEVKCARDIDGMPFVGIIDLVTTEHTIVDHKTSARAYNEDDVGKDIQITAYAFLVDRPIDAQFHVAVKTKTPKTQIVATSRNYADIEWWERKVATKVIQEMRTGIVHCNSVGWHCNPKWCGYWDLCHRRG